MHGVAVGLADAADRGLAGAARRDAQPHAIGAAQLHDAAEAVDLAGTLLHRGVGRVDELAAVGIVGVRQQGLHGHVDERRIAVEGLAIGIGELQAFDLQVDEVGAGRIHAVEVEALEKGELLQDHRALRPCVRLANSVPAVVVGERRFDRRLPLRHVLSGQHAPVGLAGDVHDVLGAAETVDRLGDEALAPRLPRPFDLGLAATATGLGFLEDAGIGVAERDVAEQRHGLRHVATRQEYGGRGLPVGAELLGHGGDGGGRALDDGVAIQPVADGG